MMFRVFNTLVAAGFTFCGVQVSASPVTDFDAQSYCDSVERSAVKTIPSDIAEVMSEDSTTVDGFVVANAVLVEAAIEIAHASKDAGDCRVAFAEGKSQFEEVYARALDNVRDQRRHRFSRLDPIRTVQQRIAELWQADQAGRLAYLELRTEDRTGADFWAARLSVANSRRSDESSKRYIEGSLEQYDWIDRRRFDSVYSDHAWILVQHADAYPAFQAEVLARMEQYLENGGIRKKQYAYLYDRVAVNTGRLQLYGTQPTWDCEDGAMELQPLEDPENVNARRAEMGMNSVEDGLETMISQVCGA